MRKIIRSLYLGAVLTASALVGCSPNYIGPAPESRVFVQPESATQPVRDGKFMEGLGKAVVDGATNLELN